MDLAKLFVPALMAAPFLIAGCGNSSNGAEAAEEKATYKASYTEDGHLITPQGWREWIYVGTPVTPHGLNNGAAPFPEVHSVYIDPESYRIWKETGTFRQGAMLAKELTMLITDGANEDGSTQQVSGRGFFQSGVFSGLEFTIKDAEQYPDEPGNWAYYSSGHAPGVAYPDTMEALPTQACNTCHEVNASEDDFVFVKFYPVLQATKGG